MSIAYAPAAAGDNGLCGLLWGSAHPRCWLGGGR